MLFHETTEINEVVERLKLEKAGEYNDLRIECLFR